VRKLLVLQLSLTAAIANSDVVFYGGDMDGRDRVLSSTMPGMDGMIFEDFVLPTNATISAIFGNYVHDDAIFTSAIFEIRSGMTAFNGGSVVASGFGQVTSVLTNRTGFDLTEYQVTLSGLNLNLAAGTYHVGMALDTTLGETFQVTTSGQDVNTAGDPNPPPTGSPIANGNAFYWSISQGQFYTPMEGILGTGTWDFSYGVETVVPEPTTFIVISGTLLMLALLRRRPKR
jgi:hypothetical protein